MVPCTVWRRRTLDYQVRQYQPYLVAETSMAGGSVSSESSFLNPASGLGGRSFGTLARYIFGGNVAQEKMEMTTPVLSDTTGAMQFVISPSAHKVRQALMSSWPLSRTPPSRTGACIQARPHCCCCAPRNRT